MDFFIKSSKGHLLSKPERVLTWRYFFILKKEKHLNHLKHVKMTLYCKFGN